MKRFYIRLSLAFLVLTLAMTLITAWQSIQSAGRLVEETEQKLNSGLAEMLAGSTTLVLTLGVAFIVVRVAHAIGLSMGAGANPPRAIGAFGTLITGVIAAGYVAYLALMLL